MQVQEKRKKAGGSLYPELPCHLVAQLKWYRCSCAVVRDKAPLWLTGNPSNPRLLQGHARCRFVHMHTVCHCMSDLEMSSIIVFLFTLEPLESYVLCCDSAQGEK